MTAVAAPRDFSLRVPFAASAVLHVAVIAAFLLFRASPHPPSAPVYRVNLVAAAAGPRQIGEVKPDVPTPAPTPTPPAAPLSRETPEPERMKAPSKAAPVRKPKIATPNAAPASAKPTETPVAGGGPTGGRGADVANVNTAGIDFPYPVYLQNVVRQIALQFKPSAKGALTAEVTFMIRRDGSVAGVRITRRSSVYSFDQDALAAIELASHAFGILPTGFKDDVLPVIFSFDPRLIH
ncbi:MAG: TonB family protein [bacterium]